MITWKERDIAQCFANIKAGLESYGFPIPAVSAMLKDRVIFSYDAPFLVLIRSCETFSSWDFVSNHGVTAVRGWRENKSWCSMQVIEHVDAIEVDYDICSPDGGLAPAVGHFIECLWPGKTDPYRVMKGLRKRGIEVEDLRV